MHAATQEPDPPHRAERPEPKETGAPVDDLTRRRVWRPHRVVIAFLGLAHWLVVLIWALPGPAAMRDPVVGARAPLPVLGTQPDARGIHFASMSIVRWYLETTSQYQRWRMFMVPHRNATFMKLEVRLPNGRVETFDPRPADLGFLRRVRWTFLEYSLMNPAWRGTLLQPATMAMLRHFRDDAVLAVRAVKYAYPIPLLEDDGTGNPLFTSAADWREQLGNRDDFVPIVMGGYTPENDDDQTRLHKPKAGGPSDRATERRR